MKILKRILLGVLMLVALIILTAVVFIRHISRAPLPDYNADVSLQGLYEPVEVYRDSFAIPHVYAKNEHDLYLATGYLLAQDRLWQMDLLRHVTEGRLSEIFGEKYIENDIILRALRFRDKSEKLLRNFDSAHLEVLRAFSEGVNQYIQANKNRLPFEFRVLGYKPELWEPYHTVNMIGYMGWDLKSGWSEVLLSEIQQTVDSLRYRQLLPDMLRKLPTVYPGATDPKNLSLLLPDQLMHTRMLQELHLDVLHASNNWAVAGDKSVTASPILANDMHLGLNIPGIWYQMHQVVEGKLNVTGLVLPGTPFVICGHNDSIAWGMTNTYVDNVDFYEEIINPADSGAYEYNGEWRKFEVRTEVINTKEGNRVEKTLRFTHRGPVVSGFKNFGNRVVTMHWVGDEMSDEIRTMYLLNRAQNLDDFKEALKTFTSISQNIAYADRKGNIGLFCAAGVPIRKRDLSFGVLPGITDEYEWKGYVPFEELPYQYNPDNGFVASANNRTVPADFPYHIGTWYAQPNRYERIAALLSAKDRLSVEDFKAIQLDRYSKLAEAYMPVFINALNGYNNLTATGRKSFDLLKSWNYVMEADAAAPLIFESVYVNLIHCIYADEMGPELYDKFLGLGSVWRNATDQMLETAESEWFDDVTTPGSKELLNDRVVCAFEKAVADLESQLGSEPETWEWGKMHRLTLKHPLSAVNILDKVFKLGRGPYPVGGSFHTVAPYGYTTAITFDSEFGASHRHIFDLSDWDNSLTVIPTGNSGIPASEHYCDQSDLYVAGKYHADPFSLEKVKAHARYHMHFQP
ncbi:MAG: penicillin acylase family protein [Bacteroidales bacterium]|nr:penicillin acylase family protein [Bacteroidales bacterium]